MVIIEHGVYMFNMHVWLHDSIIIIPFKWFFKKPGNPTIKDVLRKQVLPTVKGAWVSMHCISLLWEWWKRPLSMTIFRGCYRLYLWKHEGKIGETEDDNTLMIYRTFSVARQRHWEAPEVWLWGYCTVMPLVVCDLGTKLKFPLCALSVILLF